VSPRIVGILVSTKPWVRFLSILGFIGCGLLVVGGLIMGAAGALTEELGAAGGLIAFLYVVLALLYLFPALFLYRYADAIKDLAASSNEDSLANALTQQRKFWRFAGVLTIVLLCLYVLAFLVAMIVAAVSM